MAVQLRISDNIYQEKLITLNKQKMFITYSYNDRDSQWYFDLVDRNNNDLISGVKILTSQNLTGNYPQIHELLAGDLYCVNTKSDNTDIVTRDNFGTDKQFQLWYVSDEELASL